MVDYRIGGTNKHASDDSFTFAFIDRNSYTANDATGVIADGSGTGNRGFEEDSACFILMDKGTSNQLAGIGIASATDINDPTTLDWEYGIYATDDGLYAVINGTEYAYDEWGSDPLYTQGDFQDSVLDRLTSPPVGSNGNRYLIIATASGDWTGYENYITEYQDAWIFISPSEGMMAWVEDEDVYYVYSGSAWAEFSTGVDNLTDIGDVVISGTPANNEVLAYDTGGDWINQTPTEAGLKEAFSENTGFNLVLGTGSGQVSEGDHDHDTEYIHDGIHYLYIPACGWNFGQMHNDSDVPTYYNDKNARGTYGGDSVMKFALLCPISAFIPISPSSTVTITQIDIRVWNEGGSTNPNLTSWKTNWDDNPFDTLTPIETVVCTQNTSTAATHSLTTNITISSGDVAWIEVAGAAGWRYFGSVKVTYTTTST